MIFVDTGAWFACFVPEDSDHAAAREWMHNNTSPLVTTDFVFDELMTLFRYRDKEATARRVGPALLEQKVARLELVSAEDLHDAWEVFASFRDKEWSFTDCVSRVVMQRLGVSEAFAFDVHFRQFGTVTVVP